MLLPVSLSVLSFQGSAIVSLVKDVGKSEPTPGSARRQLLASGVTFHFFNANTGSSKWSVWLGRDAPDMQLTGYTELSPAGGLSYGSGGTATNQATYENSNWVVKPPGEPSPDVDCDAGAVFPDTNGSSIQSWAISQDNDHFGTVIQDSGLSDSGCNSLAEVTISNKLSAATSCAGLMSYAAEIDPAVEKGVKTYARKVGDPDVVALTLHMLGREGNTASTTVDITDCGSSHSYELITLNEEDATRFESEGSQGWDAAVPKSIHPKLTMASTNRAYPQATFSDSAPFLRSLHFTPLAPCSLSLAPYAVYGTQHEPFVRAAREAQRPCQAHYAFVPRLHARLHGLRLRSSNFQRPTRHGCDPHTHRALVALAVAAWYVQLRCGSARVRWRGARWAAG
jgi:hypothetical protein